MIPVGVQKMKNINHWLNRVYEYWKKLSGDIERVIELNKKKNQENPKAPKTCKNSESFKEIVCFLTLNTIKVHKLFGTSLFWVFVYKNYKKIPGKMHEDVMKMPWWVWLAIRWDSVALLNESKQKDEFVIDINEIENCICYPKAIILNFGEYSIRLDSNRSFEIYQIIDEYKKINNLMVNLQKQF